MPKLILLVGLPGSGKSTYAKSLLDAIGHVKYCSSDTIREELYGDANIQGNPNTVFEHLHSKVKALLTAGYDVVYDATNVTRKNRRHVREQFKHLADIEVHIVWAPYTECINRDAARKRTVGEEVIKKFLYRWESPYFDEGFSVIKLIYNCDVGWNRIAYTNHMLDNMKISHDNPHHTLDIADHCAAAEAYCWDKWGGAILTTAAAYHDMGKPLTKCYKSDEDGKLIPVAHYYSHEHVGAYLCYGCFTEETKMEALEVSWLVSNHMEPYFQSKYYKNLDEYYKYKIDRLHEADEAAH